MADKPRNYKREYALYHSKPEQRKKRSLRTMARRKAIKEGKVKKGDDKDIDHRKKMAHGGGNAKGNLRVRSRSANRADNLGRGGRPRKGKTRGNRS